MKKDNYKIINSILTLILLANSYCLYSQTETFKPSIKFYPSLQLMYGFSGETTNYGNYNNTTYSSYYNFGLHINTDFTISPEFKIQTYIGYNRWNDADILPIGILLKPKLTKKFKELYFVIGGGYSFGKMYYNHYNTYNLVFPNDDGMPKTQWLLGLQKYWQLSNNKMLSLNFMFNLQLIKKYSIESYHGSNPSFSTQSSKDYEFIGLNIGYHFY